MHPFAELCTMKNDEKYLPATEMDTAAESFLPQNFLGSNFFFTLLTVATLLLSALSVVIYL